MYKLNQKIWAAIGIVLKAALVLVFVFPFFWMVSVALQTEAEISSSPLTRL